MVNHTYWIKNNLPSYLFFFFLNHIYLKIFFFLICTLLPLAYFFTTISKFYIFFKLQHSIKASPPFFNALGGKPERVWFTFGREVDRETSSLFSFMPLSLSRTASNLAVFSASNPPVLSRRIPLGFDLMSSYCGSMDFSPLYQTKK